MLLELIDYYFNLHEVALAGYRKERDSIERRMKVVFSALLLNSPTLRGANKASLKFPTLWNISRLSGEKGSYITRDTLDRQVPGLELSAHEAIGLEKKSSQQYGKMIKAEKAGWVLLEEKRFGRHRYVDEEGKDIHLGAPLSLYELKEKTSEGPSTRLNGTELKKKLQEEISDPKYSRIAQFYYVWRLRRLLREYREEFESVLKFMEESGCNVREMVRKLNLKLPVEYIEQFSKSLGMDPKKAEDLAWDCLFLTPSFFKQAEIEALKSNAKSLLGMDLMVAKEKEIGKKLTPDEEIKLFEEEIRKIYGKKLQKAPESLVGFFELICSVPEKEILEHIFR